MQTFNNFLSDHLHGIVGIMLASGRIAFFLFNQLITASTFYSIFVVAFMKLHIKYDIHQACKVLVMEQLEKMGISCVISGLGEIEIRGNLTPEQYSEFEQSIRKYGIEIMDDPKSTLVQKIKDIIVEMLYLEDELPNSKISSYIAGKLNHSYGYISGIFSELTYSSIESYIILQRIERAKQMIVEGKWTLTEIAWKLNYSSVAHLSNQFKKTTGLTPSAFQRIIKRRNSGEEISE